MSAGETPATGSEPQPPAVAGRLLVLLPTIGRDALGDVPEVDAQAHWVASSAPWHPALLAAFETLPAFGTIETPPDPQPGDLIVVPEFALAGLVSGYRTQAADTGATLVEAGGERAEVVRRLVAIKAPDQLDRLDPSDELAADFQALGTAYALLRPLAEEMGHADCLDAASLAREVLGGARAWRDGDAPGARNRLRAAFEVLTQGRERFYPVDDYLLDVVLLEPPLRDGLLDELLDRRVPFTVLATGRTVEALAAADPGALERLPQAVEEGWADIVGGPYDEVDEPLRPVEAVLWQYRRGAEAYRAHLGGRSVETLARRRFGLYPMQPQVARRFGLRFAWHVGFDAGRFPVPPETKRIWEAPDGSSLESLMRPPLAAELARSGLLLPSRLARTMKDDHVATVPLAHWPGAGAGWYADLRRATAYSPVLGRWVTAGDYFHHSDRPWDLHRAGPDEYGFPYLAQAIAAGSERPVSERISSHTLMGSLAVWSWLDSLLRALGPPPEPPVASGDAEPPPPEAPAYAAVEEALNTDPCRSDLAAELSQNIEDTAERLGGLVLGSTDGAPSGSLILNPVGWSRSAAVVLPGAAPDLRGGPPLRAAQFTEDGVQAVVELPGHGFVWVPHATPDDAPEMARQVNVRERVLGNGLVEVEIDPATGGVRGVRRPGEPLPRLAQQLVATGFRVYDGQRVGSRMVADSVEVEYGGPALAQAVSRGRIVDAGRPEAVLARFRHRVRVWAARPIVELDIELSDLDPTWLAQLTDGPDPWAAYLAARWAWAEPSSSLRRGSLLGMDPTKAERPETAEVFEVSVRGQRTALLFGGLAHQQRHGPRMLDTLLVAGREPERRFRVGIVLDEPLPARALLDWQTPPVVVPTPAPGPGRPSAGWFFQIDQPGLAVTRVAYMPSTLDGRGWGLSFHVVETAGRSVRGRLRLFRDPVAARLLDFQGEHIVDLTTDGDAVSLDLMARELACIEVTFGYYG
jgi:alpha-mannosidase